MSFIPHSDADRRDMLEAIGVSSVEALFHDVPESFRFPELKLPKAASEMEILDELYGMALKNSTTGCFATFLGAGAYNHFVPSVIPYLAGRGEFATAYTPYQPEVSQGTLQAIFEYQSMIAALTGMDVVNASHYDGATSMAEAAIMAVNVSRGKRRKILVSPQVHPQYRQTLRGDLDWVIMRALEKDRERRYQSSDEFGRDVVHTMDICGVGGDLLQDFFHRLSFHHAFAIESEVSAIHYVCHWCLPDVYLRASASHVCHHSKTAGRSRP